MVDGDLFVYGGRASEKKTADAVLGDLWSYSLSRGGWRQHHSITGAAPIARYMPGVSEVNWRGQPALAVFAGETLPGSTKKTTMNDVWVYQPGKLTWTMLFESDCSRMQLPATAPYAPGPASLPTERIVLATTILGCLVASALVVGLGWKVFSSRCRPAAARGGHQAEVDEVTAYVHLGR